MIKIISDVNIINDIANNIFNFDIKITTYSKIIGYEIDNKIIGFLVYDLIYERCEIEYIAVLNEYRNKKIASKLLEYAINDCKNNHIINISLEVNVNNISAINLYKKYNFKIEAIREKYFNNDDAYLMVKEV
ncbi:MAG: GNAT family N-acetyltransferase [Lactobacillales bacterium]|nr:GNAT family N-acetyltransferase [Lactobacillales bacterium]